MPSTEFARVPRAASRVNLAGLTLGFLYLVGGRLETSLFAELLEPVCVDPVCHPGKAGDNRRMRRFPPPPEDQSVVDADPLQKKKAPPTMMREAGPCTDLDSPNAHEDDGRGRWCLTTESTGALGASHHP